MQPEAWSALRPCPSEPSIMKILIADTFEKRGISALREMGCVVTDAVGLKEAELADAVRRTECTILLVRSAKVPASVFEASPHLAVVIRAGAGYDNIDVSAASKRSVLVANCPGKNAVAVAELTFGLILALDRRIVEGTVDLRNGVWNKKLYASASGLKGRTLGIIGLGEIGLAVTQRARAFEMPVAAWSRSLTDALAAESGIRRFDSMEDVAASCDILTIHLAATPETKKIIGASIFGALKEGAMFINTSRGEVVDYRALTAATTAKKLRVGLDVFEDEPKAATGEFKDGIMRAGGIVYGTHHIGASTDQAQSAIADEAVRIVKIYRDTGRVENCVNLCRRSPASYMLLVRHLNRPGVLAHTLNAISHAGVNVEEMENVIFDGAEAACAQIKLDAPLASEVLSKIHTGNEHILGISLARLT